MNGYYDKAQQAFRQLNFHPQDIKKWNFKIYYKFLHLKYNFLNSCDTQHSPRTFESKVNLDADIEINV